MFPGIGCFKKQIQKVSGNCPKKYSQHNGYRNIQKRNCTCFSTLCHTEKSSKKHDHKNVVTGSTCQYHLRNGFLRSISCFHKFYHPGYYHCRGHCPKDSAHNCSFCSCNTKYHWSQQNISQNLERCRNKGHHNCRTPHFFQIFQIQGQPCFQKNNDQCDLTEIC